MPQPALVLLACAAVCGSPPRDWRIHPSDGAGGGRTPLVDWRAVRPSDGAVFDRVPVPGTALSAMLESGAFAPIDNANIYLDGNLAKVPDVHRAGRDFYTLSYLTALPATNATTAWLVLDGVNYAHTVSVDGGLPLSEFGRGTPLVGMFARHRYLLPRGAGSVNVTVEPPYHVGDPGAGDGQGGDHALAMDGAVAQFALGWDWTQASPDRNTGLWGGAWVEYSGKDVVLLDLAARTLSADAATAAVEVEFVLRSTGQDTPPTSYTVDVEAVDESGAVVAVGQVVCAADATHKVALALDAPRLWYPRGVASGPYLYRVRATVRGGRAVASAPLGVRTAALGADRAVAVNGRRVFVRGGNWIATDLLLRRSGDAARYDAEVKRHADAGLNLIRVWGGGIAERTAFFDACDRHGIMVWSEFWMTGDNNGRWGGDSSWPLDRAAYIANAEDTIRRLRSHPSLLVWVAGNELAPAGVSPPPAIAAALRRLTSSLDPGRPYFESSMGLLLARPRNGEAFWDAAVAVAPFDGPYGWVDPRRFFGDENPGMNDTATTPATGAEVAVPMSLLNPEIGSMSAPWPEDLVRMLGSDADAGVPARGADATNDAWVYHKYEGLVGANGYDAVYAYTAVDALGDHVEWCWRAALAQYDQYQALFEGFEHPFSDVRRHGVLLWKSQSPWPALRGSLYDHSSLEPNGGYWGVRASYFGALGNSTGALHVVYNRALRKMSVYNRGDAPAAVAATARVIDLSTGAVLVATARCELDADFVEPGGAATFGCAVAWPEGETTTTRLLRIGLEDKVTGAPLAANEYWLSDPDPAASAAQDYSSLEVLRTEQSAVLSIEAIDDGGGVRVRNQGTAVAFFVRLSGAEVAQNCFSLLPGEARDVAVAVASSSTQVEAWNTRVSVSLSA